MPLFTPTLKTAAVSKKSRFPLAKAAPPDKQAGNITATAQRKVQNRMGLKGKGKFSPF